MRDDFCLRQKNSIKLEILEIFGTKLGKPGSKLEFNFEKIDEL